MFLGLSEIEYSTMQITIYIYMWLQVKIMNWWPIIDPPMYIELHLMLQGSNMPGSHLHEDNAKLGNLICA